MPKMFWIGFFTFAVCWYIIGYFGWRVQKDALKRGYGQASANFWGVGTIFLPFVFLPLYFMFRKKAPEYVVEEELIPGQTTICPHCGETNQKSKEICTHCHKRMELDLDEFGQKQCPNCGEMNMVTADYCKKCDQRISFKD